MVRKDRNQYLEGERQGGRATSGGSLGVFGGEVGGRPI